MNLHGARRTPCSPSPPSSPSGVASEDNGRPLTKGSHTMLSPLPPGESSSRHLWLTKRFSRLREIKKYKKYGKNMTRHIIETSTVFCAILKRECTKKPPFTGYCGTPTASSEDKFRTICPVLAEILVNAGLNTHDIAILDHETVSIYQANSPDGQPSAHILHRGIFQ